MNKFYSLLLIQFLSSSISISSLNADDITFGETDITGSWEVLTDDFSNDLNQKEILKIDRQTRGDLKPFDRLEIKYENIESISRDAELIDYLTYEMLLGLQRSTFLDKEDGVIFVFNENENYYAVSPCSFDVYQWKGGQWENLYLNDNKGYNCGTRFFFYENRLHSIGSIGFWEARANLLVFDFTLGSWDNLTMSGQPDGKHSSFVGVGEDELFYLFGQDYYKSQTDTLYKLDLKDKTWSSFQADHLISSEKSENAPYHISDVRYHLFDTKNYLAFEAFERSTNSAGLFILDKASSTFHWLGNRPIDNRVKLFKWKIYHGDKVIQKGLDDIINVFDLQTLIKKASPKGQPIEITPKSDKGLISPILRWSIFAYLLGFLTHRLFVFYRLKDVLEDGNVRDQKSSKKEATSSDIDRIEKLIPFQGQVLKRDELDDILSLSQIDNFSSAKVLRNRLIKKINEQSMKAHGKALIIRQKDPNDGRMVLYQISEVSTD